jgi:uncharacterized protein YlxW (UPF0749 family)
MKVINRAAILSKQMSWPLKFLFLLNRGILNLSTVLRNWAKKKEEENTEFKLRKNKKQTKEKGSHKKAKNRVGRRIEAK